MVQHDYSCPSAWLRMQLEQAGYINFSKSPKSHSYKVYFKEKKTFTLLTQHQPEMIDHPKQSCPTRLSDASSDPKVNNQRWYFRIDLQGKIKDEF